MPSTLRRNAAVSASGLCSLSLVLALVPNPASAATHTVTNCDDSGPGSLRVVIAGAANRDTIDMSKLACRKIELTSGPIEINQTRLSLLGGPPGAMKIDAGHRSGVFRHYGQGTLHIKRLDIARGFESSTFYGSCLSGHNIELVDSIVRECRGRAIRAFGAVKLIHTRVVDNTGGAAISANNGLTALHSRICRNQAQSDGAATVVGAVKGLDLRYTTICDNRGSISAENRTMSVTNSTISGNISSGGLRVLSLYISPNGIGSMSIVNSTISGNIDNTTDPFGSPPIVQMWGGASMAISNSTIAFNQQLNACGPLSAAVLVTNDTLLDSTVIANNLCGGSPGNSIIRLPSADTVLLGTGNLVTGPSNMQLPPDTLDVDPLLAPLAENGGPTMTHALPAGSPAIDNGNNEAGLEFDQRGKGYPRVKAGQADIGAYEH